MIPVRAVAGAAALALAAASLAPAAFAAPAAGGAVGRVCAGTLGLAPGEKHYAACVNSLSSSLANLQAGRGMTAARRACLSRGLSPGGAAFDECELRLADAAPAPAAAADRDPPGAGRSYFEVSRAETGRRDQLACARLGFDPAGTAFQACVSDLRGALARASMPAM